MRSSNGIANKSDRRGEIKLMKNLIFQRVKWYNDPWKRTKIIAEWEKDIKRLSDHDNYSIIICPQIDL